MVGVLTLARRETMSIIEIIFVIGFAVLIIRNFRKDTSDGRDALGGSGSTNKPPTQKH